MGTKIRRLFISSLAVVSLVALAACDQEAPQNFDSPGVEIPQFDEPVGDQGESIAEGVDIMYQIDADEILCPIIDDLGYTGARNLWITTEPGVGPDDYEGAVFDAFIASGACDGYVGVSY